MPDELLPRVLFVGLSAAGHGGIQGFNRRVIGALSQLDVQAAVLMLADGAEQGGLSGNRIGLARAIIARARTSDVLLLGHINLLPFALPYRLLRPRGRVILFAHGIEVWGDPRYRPPRPGEAGLLRHLVDRVAIVSRYSQGLMARAFGVADERFSLFPNAVDLAPSLPRQASGPIILAVSRLGAGEREKHVDKLIRALPLVARQVPDARLIVIGEGALRDELRALAEDLGVGHRVDLPGAVDRERLDQAYAEAAVFALPSSKEGFGIVYLEAWAQSLPVIGSRYGAAGEVIENEVDGLTVDPENVPALAAALVALLRDPARAAAMGGAGRAKVERRYSGEAFVANLRALLTAPARRTRR